MWCGGLPRWQTSRRRWSVSCDVILQIFPPLLVLSAADLLPERKRAAALGASLTAAVMKHMFTAKADRNARGPEPKGKEKKKKGSTKAARVDKAKGSTEPSKAKSAPSKKRKASASLLPGPDSGLSESSRSRKARLSGFSAGPPAAPSVPAPAPTPVQSDGVEAPVLAPAPRTRPRLILRSPRSPDMRSRAPMTRGTPASGGLLTQWPSSRRGLSRVLGLPTPTPQGQGGSAAEGGRSGLGEEEDKEDAMDLG